MAFVHPGAASTYTPAFGKGAASDQLQVEFSRNPDSFAINRYCRVVPVTRAAGKYARINTNDAIRVTESAKYLWPDGTPRPHGETRRHEFADYACDRYAYSFPLGEIAVADADFDIVASHARGSAVKAMTNRSLIAGDLIDNTSGGLDNDSATSVAGGKWDAATAANRYIQLSIQSVSQTILKSTGGVVRPSEIVMVVNPDTALQMAASAEVTSLIEGSPAAYSFLTADEQFNTYGLPSRMYGIQVVVEDAVRGTSQEGATEATAYVIDDDAIFLSRPDALVSPVNSNSATTMSTLTLFSYEDMTVEIKQGEQDNWDRRVQGSVVDNFDMVLTNTASGYLVTDVVD